MKTTLMKGSALIFLLMVAMTIISMMAANPLMPDADFVQYLMGIAFVYGLLAVIILFV